MALAPPSSYQDLGFLTVFPLISPSAALNYFATSPFFDLNSSNQVLRAQQLEQLPQHLGSMQGVQYTVDNSLTDPPRLFVILKQLRHTAHTAEFLEAYYILDGIIYPSPSLMDVLRVRTGKISMHLHSAFEKITNASNFADSSAL
ncbi:hypothetical protein EON64_09165 [archaeon]|nr:MAG: hypothetical protein EON64_09165 [archaeon]